MATSGREDQAPRDRGDLPATTQRRAFTLVELLVVIAIIGILVALLLPAIQAAREAARRSECTNHLKNLTLGMLNHESASGALPASGWSGRWTGDPSRGTGLEQPGSWLYVTLPYIEQQALHDMGDGVTGEPRKKLLQERDATPLKVANCPSRRSGGPYPYVRGQNAITGDGTGGVFEYQFIQSARGDYAANVGDETDYDSDCIGISPSDYVKGSYPTGFPPALNDFSGVTFCGRAVQSRTITDGLSHTIALGEKWMPDSDYATGEWKGDDWAMFVGFQDDTVRSTFYTGVSQAGVPRKATHLPRSTSETLAQVIDELGDPDLPRELFGSSHPGLCLFSMCDGSVTGVAFDVDAEVFRQMGARNDGGVTKIAPR